MSAPPQGPGGPRPPVYGQPPRPYPGPPGSQGPPPGGQIIGGPAQGPPMGAPGGMRPYHPSGGPGAPGGPMMSTGGPPGTGGPVGGVPRPVQGQMVNLPHRQNPGNDQVFQIIITFNFIVNTLFSTDHTLIF